MMGSVDVYTPLIIYIYIIYIGEVSYHMDFALT